MKKYTLFYFALAINFAQSFSQSKNDLIPQNNKVRLVYNTEISDHVDKSSYNYKIKKATAYHFAEEIFKNRENWTGNLFSEARSNNFPYSLEYVEFDSASVVATSSIIYIDSNGYEKEIIDASYPDYNNVSDIEFIEDWYFDSEAFTLTKEIIGISPIYHYYDIDPLTGENSMKRKRRLFFIKNNTVKPSNLELLYELEYEFSIINNELSAQLFSGNDDRLLYNSDYFNIEKENSPLWSSYARRIFIETIINKVQSKSIKAYNYYTKKTIDGDSDILKALGGSIDTMLMIHPETGEEMLVKTLTEPNYADFHSVIFKENLYWDKTNHCFEKKVISVSPVLKDYHYNLNTGEIMHRSYKVAFEVYFR